MARWRDGVRRRCREEKSALIREALNALIDRENARLV